MPIVICEDCSKEIHWRNKRGNRVPKECKCGGELKRAAWDYDNHCYRIMQAIVKKGRMIICPLCGRRRKSPGYSVKQIREDTIFKVLVINGSESEEKDFTVPAGNFVCYYHVTDCVYALHWEPKLTQN